MVNGTKNSRQRTRRGGFACSVDHIPGGLPRFILTELGNVTFHILLRRAVRSISRRFFFNKQSHILLRPLRLVRNVLSGGLLGYLKVNNGAV